MGCSEQEERCSVIVLSLLKCNVSFQFIFATCMASKIQDSKQKAQDRVWDDEETEQFSGNVSHISQNSVHGTVGVRGYVAIVTLVTFIQFLYGTIENVFFQ